MRTPAWVKALSAIAVVALMFALSPLAQAQSAAPLLLVRRVDSTDPSDVKVDFVWTGSKEDAAGAKLQQNEQPATLKSAPSLLSAPKGMVLVVDTSKEMGATGGLVNVREASKQMIRSSPGVKFAIVQAGVKGRLLQDFTEDQTSLDAAIDGSSGVGGLAETKTAAIWSALSIAGNLYKDENGEGSTLQPNITLVVATNDVGSKFEAQGRSAVLSSGATLFAVQRTDQGLDPTPFSSLVAKAGGKNTLVQDAKLGPPILEAGNITGNQQYRVTYNSNLRGGQAADLVLGVGAQNSNAQVLIGGTVQGGTALRPTIIEPGTSFAFLQSRIVFLFALLLILVAAAGFAYAVTTLFVKDDLSSALSAYTEGYSPDGSVDDDDDDSIMGKSAILQRAVELTEQVANQQGMLSRAEASLERANLPLRAGEALFFYFAFVVAATLLGLLFTRNFVAAVLFGVLASMLPVTVVNFKAKRRRKKFMGQLPDTLQLLSGTLRAGYSLMQGVEAVSQEVEDPMGIELRRVVTEARLGRPLEESLDASADRMDSDDFAWAIMAIRIQREVGGNLSELLLTVADTMVQRERLRRDVSALTAEGRVSAIILGCLPLGLGVLMFVLNPEYTGVLFKTGIGVGMLIAAGVGMLIGFLWMKKIITIEI